MADETHIDIAYTHAKENLAVQRARLDNLRVRSAAVITAASVIASFLGGQALADTRTLRGVAAPVADRSLQFWEGVGFGALLLALGISAWIISPKRKGWTFRLNAKKLLVDGENQEVQQQKRELAEYMEDYYVSNETKLERLFELLQFSVVLLAVEASGFMLDLTT
jgi:hypothetical protein